MTFHDMDNLLEHRDRFRGVPQSTILFLFSVLIVIPEITSTDVQANVTTSSSVHRIRMYGWMKELGVNETVPGTFSLCPNVSDPDGLRAGQADPSDRPLLRGINSTRFYVQPSVLYQLLQPFLGSKEFMGQHLITLHINNRTIAELEDALTYAWLPSLEKSNWTETRVEILQINNGTGYFSANGSPLMFISYTLPVSDVFSPANFSRNLSWYPWLYSRNFSRHELIQILPPNDFIQRLQQKGVPVYEGPLFPTTSVLETLYLRANSTGANGYFDTDQLKTDLMGVARQMRVKEGCCEAGMSDVDVHFGLFKPHILPMRINGTFTDVTVMPMPFLVTVQQKTFVHYGTDLMALANHSDRYYRLEDVNATELKIPGVRLVELPPVNPDFSFRMYLNRPLNVQGLPLLEALMMTRLNTDIDPDGRAEVRLWDFDSNGWIVNFFVVLRHAKIPATDLSLGVDARLPYAASIYRRLDGLELRLSNASAAYKLTTKPYL
ncbi:uncharacterized protein LOC129586062 [Paramacrobiotus metropolitanus]|uniref:uncharacterized protein LOC129586062 n=1 Tax=Paramacrobiotus metropolitanus TaxID=2943436 RepID=UPI0024456634|nr:uncharacterized protein LOC129586062 [Paramacrobiotus metropolitanus]